MDVDLGRCNHLKYGMDLKRRAGGAATAVLPLGLPTCRMLLNQANG